MGQCCIWLVSVFYSLPLTPTNNTVPGPITVDTLGMFHKGLKLEVWPVGHALDCEETIEFARLFDVHCMVETFPLDQVQEAYGE